MTAAGQVAERRLSVVGAGAGNLADRHTPDRTAAAVEDSNPVLEEDLAVGNTVAAAAGRQRNNLCWT